MLKTITADTRRVILSSYRRVYKTESFITATRRIAAVDAFVSRAAEAVFAAGMSVDGSISARTDDGLYTLVFCGMGAGDRKSVV